MLVSPIILAFDAATGPVSVAVWKNGSVAAYLETETPVTQSARLVPMIEQALLESGTEYRQLSAIAATIGPGSFTGIRVGLATARGLCLAAGVKGIGFSTLEIVAYAAHKISPSPGPPVLAILNAGKGEYYTQAFDTAPHWKARSGPRVETLESAASRMPASFVTAGNAAIAGVASAPVTFPRADALAELAALQHEPAAALKPFYIRPPDATPLVKKPGVLL